MQRGPAFRIALLDASNREEIAAFYLRLDEVGRRLRFFGPVSEQALRRHVRGIDFARSTVVGMYRGQELIGVAEAITGAAEPHGGAAEETAPMAELAIALSADARGHGLGSTLFCCALSAAREHGARHIEFVTAGDNDRMKRLALGLGMHGRVAGGDWHGALEFQDEDAHLPSVHWLAAGSSWAAPAHRAA